MNYTFLHKRLNDVLLLIVISLGLYLVLSPILPEISFVINKKIMSAESSEIQRIFSPIFQPESFDVKVSGKRLIVPDIQVDGEILVGENTSLINQGIWHRPHTSTPDIGGNSVFVAHRFQYTSGPNTFYHLDKIGIGDEIMVDWEGKRYSYEVYDVQIVEPEASYIESESEDSIVTLYTCTPLWTAEKRLVVQGKLVSSKL